MYDYGWGIEGVGQAGNKGLGYRITNSQICMDARAEVYEVVVFYELISAKYTPRGIFAKLLFNALQVSGT